jgi:hypothetical protein
VGVTSVEYCSPLSQLASQRRSLHTTVDSSGSRCLEKDTPQGDMRGDGPPLLIGPLKWRVAIGERDFKDDASSPSGYLTRDDDDEQRFVGDGDDSTAASSDRREAGVNFTDGGDGVVKIAGGLWRSIRLGSVSCPSVLPLLGLPHSPTTLSPRLSSLSFSETSSSASAESLLMCKFPLVWLERRGLRRPPLKLLLVLGSPVEGGSFAGGLLQECRVKRSSITARSSADSADQGGEAS